MDEKLEQLTERGEEKAQFQLGEWMGLRQAFGLMAGKAGAADVECLRHIRDEKL